MTNSVVDAVCVIVPLAPVIVSESAQGTVLLVVSIVSVAEPEPAIEAGLKPALVIPLGKPLSLPTLRLTAPVKPLTGVMVTVNEAAPPGKTCCADGPTAIEKSGLAGVTVICRVGGFGSELPLESMTVKEAWYVPGVANVTLPGFCAVEVAGDPPGKTQEYRAALLLVPKATAPPEGIVTSEVGELIVPEGADVVYGVSWMTAAFEGTPALSSRNSM